MSKKARYSGNRLFTGLALFGAGLILGMVTNGRAEESARSEELRVGKLAIVDERGEERIVVGPTEEVGSDSYGVLIKAPDQRHSEEYWHIGYVGGRPEVALYRVREDGRSTVLRLGREGSAYGLFLRHARGDEMRLAVEDGTGASLMLRNASNAWAELSAFEGKNQVGLQVGKGEKEKIFGFFGGLPVSSSSAVEE